MNGSQSVKFQRKNTQSLSIRDFFEMFPSDEACLEHVFETRFGQGHVCQKCERSARWYRIKSERAYSCQWCGNHLHPTVNTPFEQTRTPLQLWFYAIYLFTTSRHGVSSKELERQLGVTYKTAWRMGHEIRKHMANVDGDPIMSGNVEVDETYVGGVKKGGKRGRGAAGKSIVVGILNRDGDIVTEVVDDVKKGTLQGHIEDHVAEGSTVHTDELHSYRGLEGKGYDHKTVKHGKGQYVDGDIHVNGVESFWKHFKDSLKGTHIHVSKKHLAKYAKEFEFRFNNRHLPKEMFPRLVNEFLAERVSPSSQAS